MAASPPLQFQLQLTALTWSVGLAALLFFLSFSARSAQPEATLYRLLELPDGQAATRSPKLSESTCRSLRPCPNSDKLSKPFANVSIQGCETPLPIPPNSRSSLNVNGYAVLEADVIFDEVKGHSAFLISGRGDAVCIAMEILPSTWKHGGYCKSEFASHWGGTGGITQLSIRSQRICKRPLDQNELTAGESPVASTECQFLKLRIQSDQIKILRRKSLDRKCR
jgi:hypothetical protein